MSDLPDRLRVLGEQMAEQVEPVDPDEIPGLQAERRPRGRRKPWIAAAVAMVLAGIVGAISWLATTGPADLDLSARGSDEPPLALPFGPDVGDLDPGWHERDPGPLPPRSGAAVVYADDELFVFGGGPHTDAAAYDPATDQWREIADTPLGEGGWGPEGRQVEAVWTGSEIVAVSREMLVDLAIGEPHPRRAASYDPETDRWQLLPTPPPPSHDTASGLLWSGREVIIVDTLAAYSPEDSVWRSLGLEPEELPSFTSATALVDDTLWFLAMGDEAVGHDLDTGETTRLEAPPDHGINIDGISIVGSQVTALAIGSDVVLADSDGRVSRLSLPEGEWREEVTLEFPPGVCVPSSFPLRADWSAWTLCDGTWLRSPGGLWERVADPAVSYLPDTASDGSALYSWSSGVKVGQEPHHEFNIWVPPVQDR